ncbi:unnamed protein product [Mytilus edulis]|uniref:Uncharacterized protein n=1 Tax=Mytilus edulis TaxID=6550 RepID=A0A8S3URI1_MYTED|nr:unnamed protein product [Mytilus edulis]
MKSKVLSRWLHNRSGGFIRHLQLLLSYQSKKLRSISLHNITQISNYAANTVPLSSVYGNKYQYKQYKQCVSFLLQSTHHDAVSGWLMLASLFYKMKTYSKALNVLSYSLGKCTSEKIVPFATLSSSQRELFRLPMLKKLGIIRSLRILYLSDIKFNESNLIPDELYIGGNNLPKMIPAVVYAYFLKFLCQYHLHNISNYRKSLTDLQLIIEREYLIFGDHLTAFSYHCLGVALLIVGEYEAARKVFIRSLEICPSPLLNSSHKRLSMMESV